MTRRLASVVAAAVALTALVAHGQAADSTKPRLSIYGSAQTDIGYDFGEIDPKYVDRLRVSALRRFEDQFGREGQIYFSVRQSRLGLKVYYPTSLGELFTILEFDFIGLGADAGKTMPRVRHAYGEMGAFGAGQYWSPFIDVDARPTTAFSRGDYATITLVHYPVTNVAVAAEYQYGRRSNFENDFKFSDNRLQLTLRYNFSADVRSQ